MGVIPEETGFRPFISFEEEGVVITFAADVTFAEAEGARQLVMAIGSILTGPKTKLNIAGPGSETVN